MCSCGPDVQNSALAHPARAVFEEGHPEQVLVVAQPAAAVFHVGLLHGGGIAVLGAQSNVCLSLTWRYALRLRAVGISTRKIRSPGASELCAFGSMNAFW